MQEVKALYGGHCGPATHEVNPVVSTEGRRLVGLGGEAIPAGEAIERRAFGLHPAILLTIMREQAGSVDKALAELAMNSVDAGATRIDMTISPKTFVIQDDGRGFANREAIEEFFETFGTPHTEHDAYQKFARFRVGRGQIMSYAKTLWRSGNFEMRVDLQSSQDVGYDLATLQEAATGCRIEGDFYQEYRSRQWQVEGPCTVSSAFRELIQYLPIPLFVNGQLCNTPPQDEQWTLVTDDAWVRLDRDAREMKIYNRGVWVEDQPCQWFGLGGILVSKNPLMVNMARNSVITQKCQEWEKIRESLQEQFSLRISKAKRLSEGEAAKLLDELLFEDRLLGWKVRETIRKIRFIPNVFGELETPEQFLSYDTYSEFDGRHRMVAEQVYRQQRVGIVMPRMFAGTRLDASAPHGLPEAIVRLKEVLGSRARSTKWIPFEVLVGQFDGLHDILDDAQLDPEERLAIQVLRDSNHAFVHLVNGYEGQPRKIYVGHSDSSNAWTDGSTYIAINRKVLPRIREGGALSLALLMLHEYLHPEESEREHDHDYAFYQRFHNFANSRHFGPIVEKMTRDYVKALCAKQVVPSSTTKYHIRYLAKYLPLFATRLKRRPHPPTAAADQHGEQ